MADEARQAALADALARLRTDREAIPWPERCQIANTLIEVFKEGGIVDRGTVLVPLLDLLTEDLKWEVRKVIADGLPYLRPVEAERVSQRLRADTNAFVRKAVELSKKRKARNREVLNRQLLGIDGVLEQYQWLREQYGKDVAREALAIGETYHRTLAGHMAHGMKNGLDVLQGRVATLLKSIADGRYDSDSFRGSLGKVQDLLACHAKLVEDMLAYSRSRAIPTDAQFHQMNALVYLAIDRLKEEFTIRQDWAAVPLLVDLQSDLTIQVTGHQFEQAVYNIMKNAYQSFASIDDPSHGPRVVVIGKALDAEDVVLTIDDNGVGVGGKDLEEQRIFVPGRTTKHDGCGFGLAIARNYIEIHEGQMTFDSEPGKGTTVTIIMPRVRNTPRAD